MESLEHDQRSASSSRSARAEVPADQAPTVRCILTLARRDRVPPVDLLEALATRRIEVRECVGVFRALATLLDCMSHNDSRATAVILIEPAHFRALRAEELLGAIDRFAPGVACWQYDSSANPRLARWSMAHAATPSQECPHPPASKVNGIKEAIRKAEGTPPLRLTSDVPPAPSQPLAQESPASDTEEEHPAPTPETLLTEAELAMLLDLEEPADPAAGSNGANLKNSTEPHPFDSSYDLTEEKNE